ncbi:nuclear transport factor 2 family protein [Burkholderia sp. Bp9090]|uniref:nuclear transport factor 2 family protein n=1 Tax=unclassified Burkholderia TaxID=2613784 RepID=UPI000F5E6245|nr:MULTISPECIES: nuclear transport factor 2 family protein [unclassified Burkholderia]RQZ42296.1 nuclear transport factor 2 family protein [Burkholderia sp. Bp9090]RQZ48238.1 nuclear transport factor 2 family protein [Burkholderia sp. Bp9099]
MNDSVDADMNRIFTAWHDTVRKRDLAGTAALYAERAVLETPLALAVYPERNSGLVVGRDAILTFFEDSIRKFPGDLAQWYRTGVYFVNGKQLTWEYPRVAPAGDQVDLMEMMDIDDGQIVSHRVYWGWYGVRLLGGALAAANAGVSR